jgi:thymidylate synthase
LKQYYNLLQKVLDTGNDADDRTGTGTLSLFGEHVEFDLTKGFPLLTGKFTSFKMIAAELLWFLSGSTNNNDLKKLNGNDKPTIWEEWADESGDLGPIYSQQWRSWQLPCAVFSGEDCSVDQITNLIDGLKTKPFSRRHIISAWNVADLPDESMSPQANVDHSRMALAPCHAFVQFGVRKLLLVERIKHCTVTVQPSDDHITYHAVLDAHNVPRYALSCHLYQRSVDLFLGASYNYASYALLTHMLGNLVNMVPGKLHVSYGDCHIYKNHIEQTTELLARDLNLYPLPTLTIDKQYDSIDDFTMDSFKVNGYKSHPRIYAPIAI